MLFLNTGRDCWEHYVRRVGCCRRNGVYLIRDRTGGNSFPVWCDLEAGGWTVLQRRMNGRENFIRPWVDYRNGFGQIDSDFWLGLDRISRMTDNNGQWAVRFTMRTVSNESRYAQYSSFRVRNETFKYRLFIGIFEFIFVFTYSFSFIFSLCARMQVHMQAMPVTV